MDINEILEKPLQFIKGVGEVRARYFHKLGIYNVMDMVTYFPRDYEDRNNFKKIATLLDGDCCTFEAEVVSRISESRIRKGLSIYKALLRDDTGTITASWYNQRYIKNVIRTGERYFFYGKISKRFKTFEVQNPVYEIINGFETKNICKIVPVYHATLDLSQNVFRTVMKTAIEAVEGKLQETLPQWIIDRYGLMDINSAFLNIHFPKSFDDFKNARYRLVFEELLMMQLGLSSIRSSLKEIKTGIRFNESKEGMDGFINSLPFKLTNSQMNVLREIENDMHSSKVMNRLVQGDVGSGKTIVAAIALYKAVLSGFQGAMMVPTEILAEQHYKSFAELFEAFKVNVAILTGSKTAKQKRSIIESLKNGEIQIIIGTHALLEDNVEFKRLGIVVTDEQHRFGVRQRAVLSKKGENPDILVMTATPIPRTLALILYGDLDISIINELPPGRKPIKTYSVDNSMRERINNFIRKKVEEGRQVYIVCPLVEESETIEAKAAIELSQTIAMEDFKDLRVGLIYGKMKAKQKEDVMREFVDGNKDILVSTTVIEVGVNVPNATLMIVENAERFGLSQLHQLRGRVGRGESESFCVLYNESKAKVSNERMKIMEKTNDGFIISEKDLDIRGPGEFFGTRQHGIPEFKIANLYKDIDTLKVVQTVSEEILKEDPLLKNEKNNVLKKALRDKFSDKIENLSFL